MPDRYSNPFETEAPPNPAEQLVSLGRSRERPRPTVNPSNADLGPGSGQLSRGDTTSLRLPKPKGFDRGSWHADPDRSSACARPLQPAAVTIWGVHAHHAHLMIIMSLGVDCQHTFPMDDPTIAGSRRGIRGKVEPEMAYFKDSNSNSTNRQYNAG